MTDSFDVLAMGNAILDVFSPVKESFLQDHYIQKSVMNLIDAERAKSLHGLLPSPVEVSGGSAANTLSGLNGLGGRTAFVGKVAQDQAGETFSRHLYEEGVHFEVLPEETGDTGRCLVCVTPDYERSMNTFLGVAGKIYVRDLPVALIKRAKLLYFEGYLFDSSIAIKTMHHSALLAHKHKRPCALSLSDPLCVQRNKAQLLLFIEQYTDILFANEEEILSLFEVTTFEEAFEKVKGLCRLVIVTRGEKGAVVFSQIPEVELQDLQRTSPSSFESADSVQTQFIPAAPTDRIVDLTGAGDQFAAGFLYAYSKQYSLEACGQLGALVASEVISHYGARPETDLRSYVEERGFSLKPDLETSPEALGSVFFHHQTA